MSLPSTTLSSKFQLKRPADEGEISGHDLPRAVPDESLHSNSALLNSAVNQNCNCICNACRTSGDLIAALQAENALLRKELSKTVEHTEKRMLFAADDEYCRHEYESWTDRIKERVKVESYYFTTKDLANGYLRTLAKRSHCSSLVWYDRKTGFGAFESQKFGHENDYRDVNVDYREVTVKFTGDGPVRVEGAYSSLDIFANEITPQVYNEEMTRINPPSLAEHAKERARLHRLWEEGRY